MVKTTDYTVTVHKMFIVYKLPAIIIMIIKNSDDHTLVLFILDEILKVS